MALDELFDDDELCIWVELLLDRTELLDDESAWLLFELEVVGGVGSAEGLLLLPPPQPVDTRVIKNRVNNFFIAQIL
jgi:hypothetical protein